jgi:hypothetical protein
MVEPDDVVVVDTVALQGVFIETREWFEQIEEEFLGFDFIQEGKSSLRFSFSQVLLERLVALFFKDQ